MDTTKEKLQEKLTFNRSLAKGDKFYMTTELHRVDSESTGKLRDLGVAGSVIAKLELAGSVSTPLASGELEQPEHTAATLLVVEPDNASDRGFLVVNAEMLDADLGSLSDGLDRFAAYLEPDEEITVGRGRSVLGLSSSGTPSNISRSHLVIKNSSNEPFQVVSRNGDENVIGTPQGVTAIAITDASTNGTIVYE